MDPLQHEAATGRPSINLDGWLLSKDANLAALRQACAGADVAIVEGVTGLYDSRDGKSEEGSTAQMAKWLRAPVVLVMDCWELDRSAAAVIKGYQEFDPQLRLEALIFNNLGGEDHAAWLKEALLAAGVRIRVLGSVPKVRPWWLAGTQVPVTSRPPTAWKLSFCSSRRTGEALLRCAKETVARI